ncbi:MAG: hypothetical protein ABWK53_11795 [Anaerolineales bacterium]
MQRIARSRLPRWLCVGLLFLQGCRAEPQAAAHLNLPPTPRPSPTPTASPTPLPLSALPMVALPPLTDFSLPVESAFTSPAAVLFTAGPGAAQWSDLYVLNPQGGQAVCLTCDLRLRLEQNGWYNAPRFDSPAWAPDGERFAFVFQSVQRNSILTVDRQGRLQELRASRDEWFADLAWSPAGDALAFSLGPLAGADCGSSLVCVLALDRSAAAEPLCAAAGRANRFPAWSPEGERLLFSAGEGPYRPDGRPMDLFLWDLTSNRLTRLTETADRSEVAARWSPDGTRLAYLVQVRRALGQADSSLWLGDAAARRAAPLPGTQDVRAFAWSPDGRQMVCTRLASPPAESGCGDCLPFTEMVLFDVESGDVIPLTDGSGWVDQPAWRP